MVRIKWVMAPTERFFKFRSAWRALLAVDGIPAIYEDYIDGLPSPLHSTF